MIRTSPNATLNEKNGTVDLTLKVHEKGKNSIGLTGGVSGLAGTFIGLTYQTNNFLGLGETLSLRANIGNRSAISSSDSPSRICGTARCKPGSPFITRSFNFDQAQQTEILTGQRLNLPRHCCRICRITPSRAQASLSR